MFSILYECSAECTSQARAGMLLRDHEGAVLFPATHMLFNCGDALETEMTAMEEGPRLALHWSNQLLVVETNCVELLQMVHARCVDRSRYVYQLSEIRRIPTHEETLV